MTEDNVQLPIVLALLLGAGLIIISFVSDCADSTRKCRKEVATQCLSRSGEQCGEIAQRVCP